MLFSTQECTILFSAILLPIFSLALDNDELSYKASLPGQQALLYQPPALTKSYQISADDMQKIFDELNDEYEGKSLATLFRFPWEKRYFGSYLRPSRILQRVI